ncbi:hypothetical protein [Streptomyces sp. NPDC047981]|uniref:hypothetical protein n=1 Tax=Streptomyces sp. NPDC047981 TaxID=3154610 RepID=UPI003417B03C
MRSVFTGAEYGIIYTYDDVMSMMTVMQKLTAGLRLTPVEAEIAAGFVGMLESSVDLFASGAAPFACDEYGNIAPLP